jgi:TonB family protein
MAGEKILLVEYDPRTLKETKDILMKAGFSVVEAADGLAALAAYEEAKPDLILMSPMLPKLHGFDVCQKIKSSPEGKKIPVVIITDVYKGRKYRMDAIHLYKADDYLEKPISDDDLIKTLNNLLVKYNKIKKPHEKEKAEAMPQKTVEIDASELPLIMEKEVAVRKEEVKIEQAGQKIIEKQIPKKEEEKVAKPKGSKVSLDLDIEKKLADTLSGLEIGLPKLTQKQQGVEIKKLGAEKAPEKKAEEIKKVEKPVSKVEAEKQVEILPKEKAKAPKVEYEAADILTAQDIFGEVIQGVEKEGEKEEKVIETPPVKEETKIEEKAVKAESVVKKVEQKKSVAAAEKVEKKTVEKEKSLDDLEKKLSDTLAGISKELGLKAIPEKPPKSAEPKVKPVATYKEEKKQAVEVEKDKIIEEKISQEIPPPEEIPLAEVLERLEVSETEKALEIEAPAAKEEQVVEEIKEKGTEIAIEAESEGVQFGDYILLEKIATGGMAELFKAKKKGVEGFEKLVAIKRILPHLCDNEEFIKMFIDEAKLAAQLNHPNIVQIYELGKINGNLFIAMELVDGKDLRAVLKKARDMNRLIPLPIVLYIVSKLSGALDYAHRMKNAQGEYMNIVHRDVSPQNIILSYEGEIKLVDFGIAKAAVKAHQTQTGALKGKLLYMSPEQASAKQVDKRSDIFALGIILWEMLTNKPLFYEKGDSEVSIIEKVRNAVIPDIKQIRPNVPDELKTILMTALQRDVAKRYQNASEMQIALDSLLHKMHIQVSQSIISGYISALFADDEFRLDEIERQLEPYIPETKIAPPEEKEEVKPIVMPEPAKVEPPKLKTSEVIEKPVTAKPFAKMESFKTSIEEEKKKNYLTYIIPGLIGLVVIVVILFNVFKGKETPVAEQQGKLELAQQVGKEETVVPEAVESKGAETPTVGAPEKGKGEKGAEMVSSGEKGAVQPGKIETPTEKTNIKEKPLETKGPEISTTGKEIPSAEDKGKKEEPVKSPQITTPVEPKTPEEKSAGTKIEPPPQEPIKEPIHEEPSKTEPKEEMKKPENEIKPEKPQIKEGDLVELSPDVVMPTPIKKVLPKYPPVAMKAKVEGLVILQVLVSEKGDVLAVKILKGHDLLVDAAKEAALQWKFTPATKNGIKVKIWYTITIPFKLK